MFVHKCLCCFVLLSTAFLAACGSSDKKDELPEYIEAQAVQPFVVPKDLELVERDDIYEIPPLSKTAKPTAAELRELILPPELIARKKPGEGKAENAESEQKTKN